MPIRPRSGLLTVVLIALFVLSGCGLFGGGDESPTTPANGDSSAQVTGANGAGQRITLVAPPPNSSVGEAFSVRGAAARPPRDSNLTYRVLDADGNVIGEGQIGAIGQPGSAAPFEAQIIFTPPAPGSLITFQLFERDGATGAEIAPLSMPLTYTSDPGAVAQPGGAEQGAQNQGDNQIVIETPPPGTQVGSPVVITGRTTFDPFEGNLTYRVLDAAGAEIGSGAFTANTEADPGATFNASLNFNEPPQAGPIRLEVVAPNAAGGAPIAQTSIDLTVAGSGGLQPITPTPDVPAPQQIVIASPPPGTQVGSPLVITGRTARLPFERNLGYRVLTQSGEELGVGGITVNDDGSFVAEITFNPPAGATPLLIELTDRDAASGAILAATTIQLRY
ncbi:MAG: hypothetical protein HC822_00930 [Oscillochloris sp.]|nr:hypothetical protein [Oscillochloris sp.]